MESISKIFKKYRKCYKADVCNLKEKELLEIPQFSKGGMKCLICHQNNATWFAKG